ncbi:MAG: hypothetical protein V3T30_08845, partial [Thermodesulfobacteriota bacterium]
LQNTTLAGHVLLPLDNDAVTPTLAFGDGDTGFYESNDDCIRVAVAGSSKWAFEGNYFLSTDGNGATLYRQSVSATVPTLIPRKSDLNTGIGSSATDELDFITGGVSGLHIDSSQKTTLAGQLLLPDGSYSAPAISFSGKTNTGFYLNASDELTWVFNGSKKLTFTASYLSSEAGTGGSSISFGSGSVSAPNFTFVGDYDTGLYRSAADEINLVTGGVAALTIDSSQSIGVGTTTPSSLVTLQPSADHTHITKTTLRLYSQDGGRFGSIGQRNNDDFNITADTGNISLQSPKTVRNTDTGETKGFRGYMFGGSNSNSWQDYYRSGKNLGVRFYWGTEYATAGETTYLFNTKSSTLGRFTASAGIQTWMGLDPRINQSGTAGYTALRVNSTEDATGSGAKYLLDLQTDGTSKMVVQSDGNVGIGTVTPTAKLHVDQDSTTAAIPVLYLDQADISEEMIEFNTTIGTGNAIEAIGAKTLTTTHFIKVTIPGGLSRYIPVGTIA